MADDDHTLKINPELAERLRVRAQAAGQSMEEYALGILKGAVDRPGFGESDTPWSRTSANTFRDNGFDEDSEAYADELDRICDETLRTGGVPWEQFEARLRNLGKPR